MCVTGAGGVLVARGPHCADADRAAVRQPLREAWLLRHSGRQPHVAREGAVGRSVLGAFT